MEITSLYINVCIDNMIIMSIIRSVGRVDPRSGAVPRKGAANEDPYQGNRKKFPEEPAWVS